MHLTSVPITDSADTVPGGVRVRLRVHAFQVVTGMDQRYCASAGVSIALWGPARLQNTKTPTVCLVRVVGDSGHFYFRFVSSSERKKSLAVVVLV